MVQTQRQEIAELRRQMAEMRDEIARLKGKPPRPDVKPSSTADKTAGAGARAATGSTKRKKRGRGSKRSRLEVDAERFLEPAHVPEGARFKGYEDYVVQDLEVRRRTIRYRRERWETPDGRTITAELPAGTAGHYGGELRRLILSLYHSGQMTVPRITRQLNAFGVLIDQRQVQRLMGDRDNVFVPESGEVLRAGVASAAWISVDDTGARHRGQNGYCTQVGNDCFTAFATTDAKSRLDFLEILRAGHTDYVVNVEALAYMAQRNLPNAVIEQLADGPTHFPDEASWQAHLSALGLDRRGGRARIATEGALYGAIAYHGLLDDVVVLSDDAGQFRIANHALCWVHAERLIKGLDTFTDRERAAVAKIRKLIWAFYDALKGYAEAPSGKRRKQLRQRFDQICRRKTGFAPLDRQLQRLQAQGRAAEGPGAPRGAAEHQRVRERHPQPRNPPERLRRHPQRSRPGLPGRAPRPDEDLR